MSSIALDTIASTKNAQGLSSDSETLVQVEGGSVDTVFLPEYSGKYMAKILTPGNFHSDEVWSEVENEKWLALTLSDGSCFLKPTKITANRVYDPILDNDGEATGWEVTTVFSDSVVLLISGLNFLNSREVISVDLPKKEIYPGDTVNLNYLGNEYKLFAIGDKSKESSSKFIEVVNYKLYITVKKNGRSLTQLLVAQPNFDDRMINIIFAGDIDGDETLDLIIDTSRHYNATSPTLYLSRPATPSEILKVVGKHTSVGC